MRLKFYFGKEQVISVMRLVRLPNVLIIILTQLLLRYCIIQPYLYPPGSDDMVPLADYLILVLATILIAMGGYVINDYFDVRIDSINRPGQLVVGRLISMRGAILIHMILNIIAILLGFWLSFRIKALSFGFIFPFISGLLWIYSAKYKRMFLAGNMIVSFLSAFVILIVWLYEFFWLRLHAMLFADQLSDLSWITRVFLGYALFAFLVTLIREIIKDMEDTEGDESLGCRTLPLVAGMTVSRYIVAAIIVLTMALLAYVQLVLIRMGLMMTFWYFLVTVQLMAVFLLYQLFQAREKQDYHLLSLLCKVIMIAGILSMEIVLIIK